MRKFGKAFLTVIIMAGVVMCMMMSGIAVKAAGPNHADMKSVLSAADDVLSFEDDGEILAFMDEADLLTDAEESALKSHMAKVTPYGSVGFATVLENNVGSVQAYAERWYVENIGYRDGVVLIIDMDNREIIVHSMDAVADVITSSKADVITDNIYKYASHGEYYKCAAEGFDEIAALLHGEKIAQPMKYLSNGFLALILAFLINFMIIRVVSALKSPGERELLQTAEHYFESEPATATEVNTRTVYDPIVTSGSSSHYHSSGGHSSGRSSYSSGHSSSHSSGHSSSHSSSHHTSSGSHRF